jgi:large subunit ribosomal protein L32
MLPPQKVSNTRKRKRRSHHALKPVQYSMCRQCGSPKRSHVACGACGFVTTKLALKKVETGEDDD